MTDKKVEKSFLRDQLLKYRNSIPEEELKLKSIKLINNLESLPEFQEADNIFICYSFGSEIDTRPLVKKISQTPNRQVYLPRIDHNGKMHVHPFPCKLNKTRIGLQQPEKSEIELCESEINSTIDLAVILGVGFHKLHGYRLGYGKGYFDRFLADKSFTTIGLTFEQFLLETFPVESFDVPMKMLVTENDIYKVEEHFS